MTDLTIGVTLKADGTGFVGEVKLSGDELKKLGDRADDAGKRGTKSMDLMSGALGRMKGFVLSAIGAYAGFEAAKRFIGAAATEIMAAEKATANLNAVLRATGGIVGLTAKEISDFADQLEGSTLFDDAEIKRAAAVMLTFRQVQGDTFREAISLATDLAALMGGDLQGAVLQLGKALEDPETGLNALRRSGISFTEAQRDLIKSLVEAGDRAQAMDIILSNVAGQIGGVAASQVTGLTGALNDLDDAWGDFLKSLGNFKYGDNTILEQTASILERMANAIDRMGRAKTPIEDIEDQIAALQAEQSRLAANTSARANDPIFAWLFGDNADAEGKRWAEINEQIKMLEDAAEFVRAAGSLGGSGATPPALPPPGDSGGGGESDADKQIRKVVEALTFQEAQLGRTTDEQAVYNALQQAGTDLTTKSGQQIEVLVQSILRQTDAQQLVDAAQDAYNATMEEGRALTESLRTPSEVYADTIEHLRDLLAQGAIEQETFNRAVDLADETFEKATESTDTWAEGFQNLGAVSTEALVDILTQAQTLEEVLEALGKQILQIAAQSLISKPLSNLFDRFADSLFNSAPAAGPNTNVTRSAKGNIFTSRAVTEIAEAGRPEGALPLQWMSNGDLGVNASGLGGGGFELHIHNYSNQPAEVKSRQGDDGRTMMDVIVGKVESDIARRGPIARTLERSYGLSPGGGQR